MTVTSWGNKLHFEDNLDISKVYAKCKSKKPREENIQRNLKKFKEKYYD